MSRLIVKTVREFAALASTSDTARALVDAGGIELPLLVRTQRQTAGRGRGENHWWSDAGSLTFSLVFDPTALGLNREHEPRIALAAAVAIVRACDSIAPLGIRWPNDVECRGKKLGGLLPESIATADGPRFVLGIGLNVSTDLNAAPMDIRGLATSLSEQCSGSLDKESLLAAILDRASESLSQLAHDDLELEQAWSGLDTLRGQAVTLRLGSEIVQGIGAGIGADGSLMLRTKLGDRVFHAGQVLREPV